MIDESDAKKAALRGLLKASRAARAEAPAEKPEPAESEEGGEPCPHCAEPCVDCPGCGKACCPSCTECPHCGAAMGGESESEPEIEEDDSPEE